jgi:hypothetical protein
VPQADAAYDLRYTDRDVREDPRLTELAIAYLGQYGGDFEPLVGAQRMLRARGGLTTAVTRKVLNCMRHDWNVAGELPEPKGYSLGSNVVPFPKQEPEPEPPPPLGSPRCNIKALHHSHSVPALFENQYRGWCPGVRNEREVLIRPARVKHEFLIGKTGRLIHRLNPWHPPVVIWEPNQYDDTGWDKVYLKVWTQCKNPGNIKSPIVMSYFEAASLWATGERNIGYAKPVALSLCMNCFPRGDLNA